MRCVERHRNSGGHLHVVGPRAPGSRTYPASLRRCRNRVRDVDCETIAVVGGAVDQGIEVDTEEINTSRRGIESECDTGQEEQCSDESPMPARAAAGHTFRVLVLFLRYAC